MVDIGIDRLHHVLWRSLDTSDPERDPIRSSAAQRSAISRMSIRARAVARPAGRIDVVLIASDHGARPLRGAIALNELADRTRYLVLDGPRRTEPLRSPTLG